MWLNVKDNGVYGMASMLGFEFDDLMYMFQALGLINAELSLIKPELWAGKLGVDVLWHTFSRCKWCRFPNPTDSDDIIRSSPADASSTVSLQKFISEKGRTATIRLGEECLQAIATSKQNKGLAPKDTGSHMNASQISITAAAVADACYEAERRSIRYEEMQTPLIEQFEGRPGDDLLETLHELILELNIQDEINVRCRNNKIRKFIRFPTLKSDVDDATLTNNFKKAIPPQRFSDFLTTSFGSERQGFSVLSDMCNILDKDVYEEVLKVKGLATRPRRYTVDQGLTLMSFVPFTGREYERASQMIQTFDGSPLPPFPNRHLLRNKEKDMYANTVSFVHKKGSVKENCSKDGKEFKLVKFSYSVKNVREILIEHLISLREQKITLGIWMGPTLGECIIPFIMFDHGGTSFKGVVTLLAYELCRTLHAEIIAIGDFKESEEILSKYIMPEINANMEELNNAYVVTIEWLNDENIAEFDFLFMPKDIFGEGYDNKNRALTPQIVPTYNTVSKQWSLRWGISDDKQMTFERLDIPTDRRALLFRVIPIIPHSGGDFKHQFMITGRDGHASSKAAFESLLQSQWQDNRRPGVLITQESHAREIADYNDLKYADMGLRAPPSGKVYTEEEFKSLKKRVKTAKAVSGITNVPCMLDSIPFLYWICPILHILLGIINDSKDCINETVATLVEQDTPDVIAARQDLAIAEQRANDAQKKLSDYQEITIEQQYTKLCCDQVDAIMSTHVYMSLSIKRRMPEVLLTAAERTKWGNMEAILTPVWKYRSVAPGRLAYNQQVRDLDEMMCVLEDTVAEANEQLKSTKATFKAAKDAQRNTPVRRQIDDMFNSGGARMTQSYTMQWNGHSCTLVLEFAEEFIAALREILIAAAKLKEPGDALRCAALELQLGEFLAKLKALWDVYYYINQMMSSFDRQSDAVCDRVERACKAAGLLVRAIGMSVTPKVRSLETTLHQTFRFYEGRTGHLNESPGERVHAKVNSAERHHTNTTKWQDKRDIIDDDAKRADLGAVKSFVANVKQDHTRPQSDATIERKRQKIRTVEEAVAAREAALDMLLDSVFAKFGHLVADI